MLSLPCLKFDKIFVSHRPTIFKILKIFEPEAAFKASCIAEHISKSCLSLILDKNPRKHLLMEYSGECLQKTLQRRRDGHA